MTITVTLENCKGKFETLDEITTLAWKMAMSIGRQVIQQTLEAQDQELRKTRDRKRYRCKGKKKTSIKTKLGVVEYCRNVYVDRAAPERKHCVFLLDEALGTELQGQMSEEICQLAVDAACASSYREAARAISDATGLSISAQGVWGIVQEQGAHRQAQLERFVELAAKEASPGIIKSKILCEENDGIWLAMQGKDRQEYGSRKEMKVGTAYDGETWHKMKGGKKRRVLHNKVAHASFESAEKFRETKEGLIKSRYDTSCVEVRLMGGDGAGWTLQPSMTPAARKGSKETVITVLDAFHRNKKIKECVQNEEFAALLREKLYAKEIDTALAMIEAMANSVEDESEKAKLEELLRYFTSNKDSLLGYYDRGIPIPETVNPGVVHHALLGSMESNVFTLIGNRMKGRRCCWSVNGANRLAVLLCCRHTTGIEDLFKGLAPLPEPELSDEDFQAPLSASKVPETVGKGNEFYCHADLSDIPWLREIAAPKSFSDIY